MQSHLLLELHTLELIALRLVSKRKELLLLLQKHHLLHWLHCFCCSGTRPAGILSSRLHMPCRLRSSSLRLPRATLGSLGRVAGRGRLARRIIPACG